MVTTTYLAYLVSAVFFIFGLKNLSSPKTARRGNRLAAIGMLIAIVVTLLDRQIGRLLEKLEKLGRLNHTAVFFSSDNGPHHEGGHDHRFFNSSGGLRGYKRDLYEGGIRIPMIAVWEGRIRPGTVSDHPAAFHDLMPTLAGIAGIDPPVNIDGMSFLPELLGEEQED